MKTKKIWSDTLPEKDGQKVPVNDLAFKPDGTELVVAVGDRVFIYNAEDGDLIQNLKGHKDTVYAVDYSRDGKRFASGGADKTVIIWTAKAEGILKYTHNDAIQKIAYNPATQQLCSCTAIDFGLWSPDQKSVTKYKVLSKVLSCAWSRDGQHLALGMLSGQISIRDKEGTEKTTVERDSPVWCLQFCPSRDSLYDLLAVGCWDQRLAFYQATGVQQHKDRKLGFNPCGLCFFPDGEYIVIGGSDAAAALCTKDGVKLGQICQTDGWLWAAKVRPKSNMVAVGDNSGCISLHEIEFETSHGLYGERYAYREHMTDVIVQHLMTDQKVRIKCRDYVRKIAVFKDRLAVQLPDRVHIYELTREEDPYDMHYRIKEKVYKALDCNHMAVTSRHLLLCQEKTLQLYTFDGVKEREWVLRSVIRFLKVTGGQPGRENITLGLKDGSVLGLMVDNAFPRELIKTNLAISCLDLDTYRKKLAVVDSSSRLLVFDLMTKQVLMQEAGATSVVFNSDVDNCLAYSDESCVYIKNGDFPVQQIQMQGHVVGFRGPKLFTLSNLQIMSMDIPQSPAMYRCLDGNSFDRAYSFACLGITESDWRALAMAALKKLQMRVARQCFVRLKDIGYIELVGSVEATALRLGIQLDQTHPPATDPAMQQLERYSQAELLACQGQFTDAAKTYARGNQLTEAIDLLVSLRLWEDAKLFAANHEGLDVRLLIEKQGEWLLEINDPRGAAEMFVRAGKQARACRILGEQKPENWQESLSTIAKGINKEEKELLEYCGLVFTEAQEDMYAKEVYLKLGDVSSLMQIYVKRQDWEAAVKLSEEHEGKFDRSVFLPYAEWLALNVRFDEALGAYRKAGRPDQSQKLMEQLTDNAVKEGRFKDAAYYYWLLGMECLRTIEMSEESKTKENIKQKAIGNYNKYNKMSNLYSAYQHIYSFTTDPFTNLQPEMLFQVARYILNTMSSEEAPYGISRVFTLYTLAKQAKLLGAYKLARFAYERLNSLRVPPAWQDQLDLDMLTVQAKPVRDTPELLPVCYRCGSTNPLLTPVQQAGLSQASSSGDICTNCAHPFVRSFLSFEVLPLVEFTPEDGMSFDEVLENIKQPPSDGRQKRNRMTGNWREQNRGGGQVMTTGEDDADEDYVGDDDEDEDIFNKYLNRTLEKQENNKQYICVTLDAKALLALKREEIYVCISPSPFLKTKFYKNMLPEIAVSVAPPCNRFFHEEEFEFAFLKEGCCPFCRVKDVGYYGSV